jgi:PiT family inorganic phosphate transporter
MEYILQLTLLIALYVSWSIGSNDETMAPLAGIGFIDILKITIVGGLSTLLGAVLLGQRVEHTMGQEILVGSVSSLEALVIVFSIASWITISSWRGWPISTTHSAVGSAVGVGIIKWGVKGVAWTRVLSIMGAWIASPLIGIVFSFLASKIIMRFVRRKVKGLINYVETARISAYVLFISGIIMSFVRGANDIGNATTFVNIQSEYNPVFIRGIVGLGMTFGLIVLGRRVLKSLGRELVELTPYRGLVAQLCATLILFGGTWMGVPLSSSHVLVGSIVGVGFAEKTWINFEKLLNIFIIWIGTFIGAAGICMILFLLTKLI